MSRASSTPQEAALYDTHVVPRYSELFGRLLLAELPARERLQVLDIGCGTGYPSLEVLRRLREGGRVIAIDTDAGLVDLARRRALEESGRRIFFKVESAEQLAFGGEVFDLVMGNLALGTFERPERALAEMHRVLVRSGRLLLTRALSGTFEEVLDMFRELALKHDRPELSKGVERVAGSYPTAAALEAMVFTAGFSNVRVTVEEFQIPFPSAGSIFVDPMIVSLVLPEWRAIAGNDSILSEVQRSLETYFGGGPLSLRVSAGLVSARA